MFVGSCSIHKSAAVASLCILSLAEEIIRFKVTAGWNHLDHEHTISLLCIGIDLPQFCGMEAGSLALKMQQVAVLEEHARLLKETGRTHLIAQTQVEVESKEFVSPQNETRKNSSPNLSSGNTRTHTYTIQKAEERRPQGGSELISNRVRRVKGIRQSQKSTKRVEKEFLTKLEFRKLIKTQSCGSQKAEERRPQ